MSYRDMSLLCFEGCVNAINGFIEKGTEHHTRIAARKRREGVDHHHDKNQLEIQWTVEFKEGVLKCNIATLRRQKSESLIHEFEFEWQISFSVQLNSFEF